jgi:hypothetical protein
MVIEEPLQIRDLAEMGQLYSLGIGKGMDFKPDPAASRKPDNSPIQLILR